MCSDAHSITFGEILSKSTNDISLHKNIDQRILNTIHGPMYYKIGIICVFTMYSVVIT